MHDGPSNPILLDTPAPPRARRGAFRFSLRTLLICTLLAGAIGLLIRNWAPWILEFELPCATPSPHNTFAFVTKNGALSSVWDLGHTRELLAIDEPLKSFTEPIFSNDWRFVAVLTDSNMWCIYDVMAGKKLVMLKDVLRLDENAFSPDGERIVGVNQNFQFAGFDMQSGKQLYTLEHPKRITHVAFKDTGTLLVECYSNNNFEADPNTGKALLPFEDGPDEAGPKIRKIKIWDLHKHGIIPEGMPFRDGRFLMLSFGKATILNRKKGKELCTFGDLDLRNRYSHATPFNPSVQWSGDYDYAILDEGRLVMISEIGKYVKIYRNRRPERWWGTAWLLEFWLAFGLFALFVWSIIRDWRTLGKRESVA